MWIPENPSTGGRRSGLRNRRVRQPGRMHTDNEPAVDVSWYDAVADEVRGHCRDADEGTTWVLFIDGDGQTFIGMAIERGDEIGDEIGAAEYDGLAQVIDEIGPPAVVVAVTREEGEPLAADWQLWQQLRARLTGGTELIDVLVVGRHSWWAVVGGRPDRAR